ncbi:uncharacterized protein LOC143368544 [Andrena cerasifolii]|uniref:uncharacterized protein LOC143368544 n=1 Tax=Andrena cerasifolii TaxID=2819439 RepID=UPI0040381C62
MRAGRNRKWEFVRAGMALSEREFVFAPRIPRGLGSAVEGLAREILRHRPRDIYAFAAHHFEELVKLREKVRDAAGIVSTRTRDCDSPARNGQQDRILDWDHSGTRKIVDFIEETAIKELVAPAAASKLSKKRREATTFRRSGWSINQTVRALKRHDHSSADKAGKLDNRQYPEECTPRSSRKMTRGRFLRSLSAGDIPARTIKSQLKDNREKFCNCVSGKHSATDTTAGAGEEEGKGEENSGNATTTLKRQSSADEIERRCSSINESKRRYVTDARKTRSATNGRWKRNGTTDDTERGLRRAEKAVVQQLSLQAGQEEEESKIINELGPTLDCDSRSDALQDPNHGSRTANGNGTTENASLSIVLPSVVVARPSSFNSNGYGYSKNGSRNHVHDSREENSHGNDLILPPISSDVSKPIKKENTLTLPYLHTSKATEAEAGQRPTPNEKDRLKADALLEPRNPEAVNSDYDSISLRQETVDPTAMANENDQAAACMADEHPPCEHETDEISALARTDERDVLEELGMARLLNLPETDVDESFKDSLNVTPDSIEFSQRSDSLEHPKEKNSPIRMLVDDAEERKEEELECRQSSELKNKLIEIETAEKNIENALVSSGSPMPPTVRSSSRSSEAGESSCLLGNETILFCADTREEANSEEHERTMNDSSQRARLNVGQGGDVDRANVQAGPSEKPSKGVDLSCYVLTEGSPCEIPESVTTVIISDNIENDVPSEPTTLLWKREMRQELEEEEFPSPKGREDPFGEYVRPGAGSEYSTGVDLDFLGGIKMNSVDRSTTCQNLGNIKEEEENEKQVSALPADVAVGPVDSGPPEKMSIPIESDSVRTDSEPLRTGEDARADEGVDTSSFVCSKEHGETSALNDCFRDSSSSLVDATGPPYVPELNLDSLRDVTIVSSFERSDSRNDPHKSDREYDNDEDVTLHEDGQTLSSIDTLSSGKKAIVEQHLPLNSQQPLLLDAEELSNAREQGQLIKIENETGECCGKIGGQDSPNTEEEIARELIENLTLEMPPPPLLGELPNAENAASLSTEFHPLVREIPSPVMIGSVDVTSALCPETPTTSYEGEKASMNSQGERKEEGCRTSETSNDQLGNDSTASFLETACETAPELDSIPKDQDQREKSEIKANSRDDTKEVHIYGSVENETPPDANTATATGRKIQVWTREFVLGQRSSPTTDDEHPKPIQHLLHQLPAPTGGTSEEYLGDSPSSNDQRHERLQDRGQSEELDAPTTTAKTTWSDVRQTGEFHDSLPLPLLEVARSGTLSKDASALTRVYKHCEPDAPTFASESPRASVLCSCTVDLSETLRLIGNGSDWSRPYSKLPVCVVLSGSDNCTVPRFVTRIVNSATEDGTTDASLVREPLALVDSTPESIVIEEIPNSDEEKEQAPAQNSPGTVTVDLATRGLVAPEEHSNRNA